MKARVVVGIFVGAVSMTLAFWGVPFRVFIAAFEKLDPTYLLPIAILFYLQEVIRSLRQLVFMRPLAPRMRLYSSVSIFFISFLCIHLFPARLGEVVRPYLLSRREHVPLSACTGVVVAERAIDGLAAVLMFVAMLLWVDLPENLVIGDHAIHLATVARIAGLTMDPGVLAAVLVMTFAPGLLPGLLDRLLEATAQRLHSTWLDRRRACITGAIQAFALGFSGLRRSRSVAIVAGLTVLSWSLTACMYWLLACGFGIDGLVGIGESFGVMVITLWAAVLPAPPAMAGVQEAFGRGALALFGVSGPGWAGIGLAYAVVIHWGQVLLQALGAWIFITRDGVSLKSLSPVQGSLDCSRLADP